MKIKLDWIFYNIFCVATFFSDLNSIWNSRPLNIVTSSFDYYLLTYQSLFHSQLRSLTVNSIL
jgi:hypothetical protein